MTESPVLGKVREQFADLEQSSLRNDIFLGARSHLSSECLKRTHRLLIVTESPVLGKVREQFANQQTVSSLQTLGT